MNTDPEVLIHLAYGNPPTLCGLNHVEDRVLYVPTLWHTVPPGFQCPTCNLRHIEYERARFN